MAEEKEEKESLLVDDFGVGNRVYVKIYKQLTGARYALILQFQIPPTLSELKMAMTHYQVAGLYPTNLIGVRVLYPNAVCSRDDIESHKLNERRVEECAYDAVYKTLCPEKYGFGPEDSDAAAKLDKTNALIRRYKPLLLWLQLAVKSDAYTSQDRATLNFVVNSFLNYDRPYQQLAGLVSVTNMLEIDDRQKNSSQLHLLGIVEKLLKEGGITDEQKGQVNNFYEQLKEIFSKDAKKAVQPRKYQNNDDLPVNPNVTQLMQTQAYQALIERIEKIEKRVDLNEANVNDRKNLLKADGILALEEAFERALGVGDAKAYQIITQAILKNGPAISAYAGGFSEDTFSFFTGNKSTSDGLLKEITAQLDQLFPEAAKSQLETLKKV